MPAYDKVKGIHPGAVLRRELTRRGIKAVELARSINEHPQTLNAFTKERRGVNPKLSIKLGDFFNDEKEYFMLLQASFEVRKSLQETYENPLIGKIRNAVFWDTNFSRMDIIRHRTSIIQRILERGNKSEISDLVKLYGRPTIKLELEKIRNSFGPNFDQNVRRYIYEEV